MPLLLLLPRVRLIAWLCEFLLVLVVLLLVVLLLLLLLVLRRFPVVV